MFWFTLPTPLPHNQVLHLVFGLGVNAWICLRAGEGPLGTLLPFMRSTAGAEECRWELAVAPAHLVLSVYWTLKTASAYLAGRLGMSFTQLFDSHAMWNIVHAFDFVTGALVSDSCTNGDKHRCTPLQPLNPQCFH